MKNRAYTYFYITGNFDIAEVVGRLGVEPFSAHRAEEKRRDGKPYGFSALSFARAEGDGRDIAPLLAKTVAALRGKEEELERLQKKYGLSYTVEIVPELSRLSPAPALHLDADVVGFCHAVGAEIDIDLYFAED